jgi:uncharacterized protein (DUF2147 family)
MKKIKSTIVMLLIAITSLMAQNNPDAIIGTWETDAKDAKMEVYKNGDAYYGKLLWGDKIVESDGKTSKKDSKNPNEKLQTRNIIGIVNLTGLKFKDGEYVDGRIYDPPSGKTYDCKAWLKNGQLHLRGYLGFSMIGQTAIWHKL